ncbi:MAG: hypothetical protein CM1200mP2_37840 [Planctomycetaceae bacterium]|nr:MAG: hypothetical protein CM1200mP2_37840 [Planctomycetaceae bacterium]
MGWGIRTNPWSRTAGWQHRQGKRGSGPPPLRLQRLAGRWRCSWRTGLRGDRRLRVPFHREPHPDGRPARDDSSPTGSRPRKTGLFAQRSGRTADRRVRGPKGDSPVVWMTGNAESLDKAQRSGRPHPPRVDEDRRDRAGRVYHAPPGRRPNGHPDGKPPHRQAGHSVRTDRGAPNTRPGTPSPRPRPTSVANSVPSPRR